MLRLNENHIAIIEKVRHQKKYEEGDDLKALPLIKMGILI